MVRSYLSKLNFDLAGTARKVIMMDDVPGRRMISAPSGDCNLT